MSKLVLACLLSLIITVIWGKLCISLLKKLNFSQTILSYVGEHKQKNGTPTLGGIIFVIPSIVLFLLFSSGNKLFSLFVVAVFFAFFVVGFLDDFIKIKYRKNQGLTALQKIICQLVVACLAAAFVCRMGITHQYIPFTKLFVEFEWWFLPIGVVVFLSCTNCVNLTDGLDGLAATTSCIYLIFSAVLIYFQMQAMPNYYQTAQEYYNLILLNAICAFSLIGYLCYNTNKASVFMGDAGSLALGGLCASTLMMSGNTFYIPILGIVFVASGLSVIIQVLYYKRTKKRVFLMAPLHHHFQHLGFNESKIVYWYKFVCLIAGLICIICYL